jgi:hypothetical protein
MEGAATAEEGVLELNKTTTKTKKQKNMYMLRCSLISFFFFLNTDDGIEFLMFIIFNNHSHNHTFIHPSSFAEACLLVSSSLLRSAREEPP